MNLLKLTSPNTDCLAPSLDCVIKRSAGYVVEDFEVRNTYQTLRGKIQLNPVENRLRHSDIAEETKFRYIGYLFTQLRTSLAGLSGGDMVEIERDIYYVTSVLEIYECWAKVELTYQQKGSASSE